MAEEGLGLILEIAIELVPSYFGAFLRWIYHGFKIPFSKILKKKGNTRLGATSLGILVLIMLLILNA